jgi:hypothetical protein
VVLRYGDAAVDVSAGRSCCLLCSDRAMLGQLDMSMHVMLAYCQHVYAPRIAKFDHAWEDIHTQISTSSPPLADSGNLIISFD